MAPSHHKVLYQLSHSVTLGVNLFRPAYIEFISQQHGRWPYLIKKHSIPHPTCAPEKLTLALPYIIQYAPARRENNFEKNFSLYFLCFIAATSGAKMLSA
jgi:hypothetical protein